MSSAVYFKFKASLKQYTIPFEGSAISVKDLRNAIRISCGLKSTDFELQILDKQGKDYSKEEDLIPKFSDLIVRRLPKANDPPKKKIANPEDMTRRDPYKAMNALPRVNLYSNSINLAKANIPDDEKLDIMTKRCSEEYSEKNYLVKPKPYGVPPASYVCNKCHQGGHWIHECPGLRDREGKLLDFKSVKRPTGIPQDFLLEVAPGTPGAYLTKEGKYMVPIKDAEAYAMGKKEKRPFSIEENPPYIVKDEELPAKLKCLLCSKLLENPTSTPCCSSVFCVKCISDYLYDPEVNGSRQCPSCLAIIDNHESLVDNELLRQLIQCWKANMLTKEIVDSFLLSTAANHNSSPSTSTITNKKTELNEDSSKSPEMKFNSASDDTENGANVVVKTEKEKIFVNNRRVLKPKVLSGKGVNSPSDIKTESVDKEQDVNDLIFEKVQDTDIKTEIVVKVEPPIIVAGNNDHNLKIETIAKRSDGGPKNIERKGGDNKYRSKNDCQPNQQQQHSFDHNTQMLNHFPNSSTTAHIVNSVQQQMLDPLQWPLVNPLFGAINPLQTMFGAALNTVNAVGAANWINNGLNNIQATHPINTNNRILTKEEFYDRQRRLRAEKLKHTSNTSRSPSGSQSPRRSHRSKYEHSHKKDESSKARYNAKSKESKEPCAARKSRSSRTRDTIKSSDQNLHKPDYPTNSSDIKTIDPKLMQDSIKTFLKYLTANPSSNDEVTESTADNIVVSRIAESSGNNKHSGATKDRVKVRRSHEEESKRRSTRSRSVPKVSKDRLMDGGGGGGTHGRAVVPESRSTEHRNNGGGGGGEEKAVTRHREKKRVRVEKTEPMVAAAEESAVMCDATAAKSKAKKVKHKHHHHKDEKEEKEEKEHDCDDRDKEDDDARAKRHKHKKHHKHKKVKKTRRTKHDGR